MRFIFLMAIFSLTLQITSAQCPKLYLFDQTFSTITSEPNWQNCIDNPSDPDSFVVAFASPNDIYSYELNFGDGTEAYTGSFWPADSIIYHTYPLGSFNFTLRDSCLNTMQGKIINDRKPGATAIPPTNYSNGCVPHALTFINQSSNTSPFTKFTWTWGDGMTDVVDASTAGQPITHEYKTAKCNMQVKLVATSLCASSYSLYGPYDMWDKDIVYIRASANKVCIGDSVTFSDSTLYNCNNKIARLIKWDFSEIGGPVTDWLPVTPENKRQKVFVTGPENTTYKIFLYDSSYCGVSTGEYSVKITNAPKAEMSLDKTSICQGTSLTIQNLSSGGANVFFWDYGAFTGWKTTKNTKPVTHTYTGNGDYKLRLVAQIQGAPSCADTTSEYIKVLPSPIAGFNPDKTEGCLPLEVKVADSSINASSAEWTLDSHTLSTADVTNGIILNEGGIYQLTQIVKNDIGCSASLSKTITAFPDFNLTASFNGLCSGSPVTATDQSTLLETARMSGSILREQFNDAVSIPDSIHSLTTSPDEGQLLSSFEFTNAKRVSYGARIRGFITPPANGNYIFYIAGDIGAELWLSTDERPEKKVKISFTSVSTGKAEWEISETQKSSQIKLFVGKKYFIEVIHTKDTIHAGQVAVAWKLPNGSLEAPIGSQRLSPYIEGFKITSTSWTLENGATYYGKTARFTFDSASSYPVKLNVSNGKCLYEKTLYIKIEQAPTAFFSVSKTSGCTPLDLVLYNHSSNTNQLKIDFGDGTIKEYNNPDTIVSYRYYNNGSSFKTFVIKLIAKNEFGCSDTTSTQIKVYPENGASFSMSSELPVCSPAKLNIKNDSDPAEKFTWQIRNETFESNESSFFYDFINTGTTVKYDTVKLTATFGTGCYSEIQKIVTIYPDPNLSFSGSIKECNPPSILFTPASGFENHIWHFGDGAYSESESLSHTYRELSVDSIFKVTLAASSYFGCTDTTIMDILVPAGIKADFSLESSGCTPLEANISNTSVNATNFKWNFGETTSYSQINDLAFTKTLTNEGSLSRSYSITLIAENENGCIDTIAKEILVHPKPHASMLPGDTIGCSPLTVSFTNRSTGAQNFKWFFPGPVEKTGVNSETFTFLNEKYTDTTYTVVMIAESEHGCVDSTSETIYLSGKPSPVFNVSDTVFFPGETLETFNNTLGDFSYLWEATTGETSIDTNASFYMEYSGEHSITLTAFNNYCSIDSSKKIWVVNGPPEAEFTGSGTGCGSLTITFQNSSFNAYKYIWDFGDGDSLIVFAKQDVSHTFKNYSQEERTFNVTLTAIGLGGVAKKIKTKAATLLPLPALSFRPFPDTVMAPGEVHFVNESDYAIKYIWHFGEGETSESEEPKHTFTNPGLYDVTLIGENAAGCRDSVTLINSVTVLEGGSIIMPNAFTPSSTGLSSGKGLNDHFKPGFYKGIKNYKLEIFDKWGSRIFMSENVETGWDGYFNGKKCQDDVYVYKVHATFSDNQVREFIGNITLLGL